MFSKEATKLVGFTFIVFITGLVLGNYVVLGTGLIPLFVVLLGLLFRRPDNVEVVEVEKKVSSWVGV